MSDTPKAADITALIKAIVGTAASDDGNSVKVGIVSEEDVRADLIIPVDQATGLMALLSAALGHAARNRSDDPSQVHGLPATRWQIYETPEPQMLLLAFQLAGGAELFFRIDQAEARQAHEALGVVLGLAETTPIPKSQQH